MTSHGNTRTRLRRAITASLFASCFAVASQNAPAQDVGKAITDAIGQNLSGGNAAVQGNAAAQTAAPQNAVDRGIGRAVQGALQGQTPRDAVRSGLGEAVQSSAESPQQTMLRDQAAQFGNRPLTNSPNGQPWQMDAQGRAFYQDASGQAIYANVSGQNQTYPAGSNAYNQSRYGAQFQARDQGIGIQSVREGGFAAGAGLQQGDVVLKVNGQAVHDQNAFSQSMSQVQPQQPVTMTILRNGQEMTIRTTAPHASSSQGSSGTSQQLDEMRNQIRKLQEDVEILKKQMKQTTKN